MTVEEAQKQVDECTCNGSMAKPYLFCDDCQEARDVLDEVMFDDSDRISDVADRMVDEFKDGDRDKDGNWL